MDRPSWDNYFMDMANLASTRATCPRASVGAVIVKDKKVISTGYNGAPKGMKHCTEIGCLMVNNSCVRGIHAEANAILQAKQDLTGATIYTTHQPCVNCAKLIMGAGIARVVYNHQYWDQTGERLFLEGGYVLDASKLEGMMRHYTKVDQPEEL